MMQRRPRAIEQTLNPHLAIAFKPFVTRLLAQIGTRPDTSKVPNLPHPYFGRPQVDGKFHPYWDG